MWTMVGDPCDGGLCGRYGGGDNSVSLSTGSMEGAGGCGDRGRCPHVLPQDVPRARDPGAVAYRRRRDAHRPADPLSCWESMLTRSKTSRSDWSSFLIFWTECITVVWSRPPNCSPILGSERSVRSLHRYMPT